MRALLIVLDSVGVGGAPDAAAFGDSGADTLGHILDRQPGLKLPHLDSLGLKTALKAKNAELVGLAGRLREESVGKDTTTGHWELAGVLLEQPFQVFDVFPAELVDAIEAEAGVEFIGNYACSGTEVLLQLGAEHVQTGKPILYTSADSVLQIAAHEEAFGLQKLYAACDIARRHCDAYRIGRVIARPFTGDPGSFVRTSNRHDYSMIPPRTVLNALQEAGQNVTGIGKISDIYAGSGVTASFPTTSNAHGMETIETVWNDTKDGLVFANLVDFDMLFGHRRDVRGYANCLDEFDRWLGGFIPSIGPEDLLVITADHGNDPTAPGTDHTREEVPVLIVHGEDRGSLGTRRFVDVAATLAAFLGLPAWDVGSSLLP